MCGQLTARKAEPPTVLIQGGGGGGGLSLSTFFNTCTDFRGNMLKLELHKWSIIGNILSEVLKCLEKYLKSIGLVRWRLEALRRERDVELAA